MDDQLRLVGSLKGHSDWVTQIATRRDGLSSGTSNEKGATRPQSLRLRPRHLVGRPIRSLEFVGLDASPLGRPERGPHNATLRRTHERRPQRRLLGRQSPNRLGIARPNDPLEYARSKQISITVRKNWGFPGDFPYLQYIVSFLNLHFNFKLTLLVF